MGEITKIETFGDVRHLILQSIMQIRDGGLDTSQALAIAAHFKCLNDNINAEVNAAKLSIAARKEGMDFGNVLKMGQRKIGNAYNEDTGTPALIEACRA